MTDLYVPLFYILLFIVSFLYSSVGHGGASGYLALMAFFSFSPDIMRPSALLLNIMVSFIAFLQYAQKEKVQWKLVIGLLIFSFPMAFLGGTITVETHIYKIILGSFLLIPIIRFIGGALPEQKEQKKAINPFLIAIIGSSIGLLSGLIGMGGGIILTPVLLLLSWSTMKEVATISALFILVNSTAGLIGTGLSGFTFSTAIIPMLCTALSGGIAGSFLGAGYFNSLVLKKILAVVLLIAAFKLWFT